MQKKEISGLFLLGKLTSTLVSLLLTNVLLDPFGYAQRAKIMKKTKRYD